MPSKKDKISTLNSEPDKTASKKTKAKKVETEETKKVETEETKKVETEETKKVETEKAKKAKKLVTEVPEKSKSKAPKKSKKTETDEPKKTETDEPKKTETDEPKKTETDEPKKANTKVPKKSIKTDGEVPKKGKAKKVLETAPVVQITEKKDSFVEKSISTDDEQNNLKKENNEPDDIEYEAVKKEWAILCEQINVINEEREVLELKKNKLLQKLCKLGENNMPKGENIFNINSKSKLDITNTILENDSDSSDSSDSDDSDSDDEPVISKKKVLIKKADSDSDSD
jgi:hypothetical protein